jgi:hypothetical protein
VNASRLLKRQKRHIEAPAALRVECRTNRVQRPRHAAIHSRCLRGLGLVERTSSQIYVRRIGNWMDAMHDARCSRWTLFRNSHPCMNFQEEEFTTESHNVHGIRNVSFFGRKKKRFKCGKKNVPTRHGIKHRISLFYAGYCSYTIPSTG